STSSSQVRRSAINIFSFRSRVQRVQAVQPLRSVQMVQFPHHSAGVRSNLLNCWNDLNGLNGCYLTIAGTCGACVVCKEFSGCSRYKPKALTMGISLTENKIASFVFERLTCSCQAQFGTAKPSCCVQSMALSP